MFFHFLSFFMPALFFPSSLSSLSFFSSLHSFTSLLNPTLLLAYLYSMNVAYSSVVSVSIEGRTTHEHLTRTYESHIERHGSSPSLQQLFETARDAASSDQDRAVVRIHEGALCFFLSFNEALDIVRTIALTGFTFR